MGGHGGPLMPGCTGDARLHIDRVTALHYLVRSVGLLWWLLHKMELVGATLKLVSSMDWWPGMEACWPSCRAGSHCGERVSWALRMERSGGHQLP